MARFLTVWLFLAGLMLHAQPTGPTTDALFNLSVFAGSNGGPILYWLKPDGTYVILQAAFQMSGVGMTYSSGRVGTYTLKINADNPRWRDIAFDGGTPIVLDFDHGYDPQRDLIYFTWHTRTSGDGLLNASSRALATADHPAITGFVIGGTKSRWVLVRGIGPALADYGVSDPVAAPQLQIVSARVALDTKLGWSTTPEWSAGLEQTFNLVGAFALPRGSADRAVLVRLEPGAYTALTFPGGGQPAGSTLTEVYVLPYVSDLPPGL